MRRNVTADTVVYSAAIWWRDCDPMYNILATTHKRCQDEALKALRREAREAYTDADPEYDKRKMYQFLDDVCWSGVCQFTLSDLAGERELAECIEDLNTSGFCYLSR